MVTATLYHGSRRRQDIDNYTKVLLDALTGTVFQDDSQIVKLSIEKGYDKIRPRVELEVCEM